MSDQFLNSRFLGYLGTIDVPKQLDKRINDILDFYSTYLSVTAEDIFVSEYVASGGSRELESLWLFSKGVMAEANEFITKDNLYVAPIEGRIKLLQVLKQAYDFANPTSASRLTVHLEIDVNVTCDLKASGKNCDYLRDILVKYLRPNMMKRMAQAV